MTIFLTNQSRFI